MDKISDLKKIILKTLDNNKALDIVSIDLTDKSSIADHMIIASGNSTRQVVSLAENLVQTLKKQGLPPIKPEGLPQGDWVLIDAGNVIVHIFRPEVRDFYKLEKMWEADLSETNNVNTTH
mgnify:CR=1 FL=1